MVQLTCNEALGVVAIRYKMSRVTYRFLAEWLNCYSYVIPAERELSTFLMRKISYPVTVLGTTHSSSDWFKIWLLADLIECTLTKKEQERILSWMTD